MATKKQVVEVKPVELATAVIRIDGITPLIEDCWLEKGKEEMLGKMMGTQDKSKKRDPKNPVEDFIRSMYWITPMPTEFTEEAFEKAVSEGARFGFPVTGIKQAAISGAYRKAWVDTKMALRGVFFIEPDAIAHDGTQVVEIISDAPAMREDNVKVGMGTADLRYRGEFRNWHCNLKIQYDINGQYSINDIVNYINAGGFACGIGEWRPERDGQSGMFRVSSYTED